VILSKNDEVLDVIVSVAPCAIGRLCSNKHVNSLLNKSVCES